MTDMSHLTCILVPIDGSECSRWAARHAVQLAQAQGARLIFLHVVDSAVVDQLAQREPDGEPRVRDRLFENGRTYLRDVAAVAEECHVDHQEQVTEGDPCAVICDTAAATAADLIVMGKIGRRGARRILVGSITRGVIEFCDRAVLVIAGPPPDVAVATKTADASQI